jgi:hypothetical protein
MLRPRPSSDPAAIRTWFYGRKIAEYAIQMRFDGAYTDWINAIDFYDTSQHDSAEDTL